MVMVALMPVVLAVEVTVGNDRSDTGDVRGGGSEDGDGGQGSTGGNDHSQVQCTWCCCLVSLRTHYA